METFALMDLESRAGSVLALSCFADLPGKAVGGEFLEDPQGQQAAGGPETARLALLV